VNRYLQKKWPQLAFEVEKLQSKGSNSSFKVSTQYDKDLLTLFYTPSNWPEGVVIKQFRFFDATIRDNFRLVDKVIVNKNDGGMCITSQKS
jgi:hypothetical protein